MPMRELQKDDIKPTMSASCNSVLAATLIEPGRYELREFPLPEPDPGCVLVKMELSGICGTDKHTYQGFVTQYGERKLEFPLIQGHENVGTIAAIGGPREYADFEGIPLKVGDRVVVSANAPGVRNGRSKRRSNTKCSPLSAGKYRLPVVFPHTFGQWFLRLVRD